MLIKLFSKHLIMFKKFIIKIKRRMAHVERMGRGELYTGILWDIPDGKRLFGRPRIRW
jgi:hypothetical protein